jgi:hypothetical protein
MKMKKTKITTYLKTGILFLGVSLLLWNCEKDEFIETSTTTKEFKYKLKDKNFEQLTKEEKFNDAFKKVFKPEREVVKAKSSSKTVMEERYGFTIDSTLIKEISSDKYISYTFLIHRDVSDDTYFENLVITIDSLDVTRAHIVKYILNSKPIFIEEDNAYTLNAKKEITSIEYNNTQAKVIYNDENGCILTLMCPWNNEEHVAGDHCIDADRQGEMAVYWSEPDCGGTGGGGNNEDDSSGNQTGTNTGGNTNDTTEPNPNGGGSGGVSNPILTNSNLPSFEDCEGGKVINGKCIDIPTPCETALLSRDVYNTTNGQQELGQEPIPKKLSGGWELNNSLDTSSMKLTDPNSGFNSAVYQKSVNGDYQYMYVTEGTDLISIIDWYNNISQVSGNSEQYEISVQNAEKLNNLVGNKQLYFTGHSLGGGLASANSLATGRTAYTYNAAGLSYETRILYNRGHNSEIQATVVKGEIIDKVQSQFGIKAEDSDTINYIEEESTYWQDFFNKRSPALNTYKAARLHMIGTIIDILDCE